MNDFIVIDLEMCRVPKSRRLSYHKGMETIQIGAVRLDMEKGVTERFQTYVRPAHGHIGTDINVLTGISGYDVKRAPEIKEAISMFLNWVGNKNVTFVSWSMTDHDQILGELRAKGIEMEGLEERLQQWEDAQGLFSDKMDNPRQYSLDFALKAADIETKGREHNALADTYNTALLFRKMKLEENLILNKYYQTAHEDTTPEPLHYSLCDMLKGLNLSAAG